MMWMGPAGRLRQLSKELEGGAARNHGSEVGPCFVILFCDYLIND